MLRAVLHRLQDHLPGAGDTDQPETRSAFGKGGHPCLSVAYFPGPSTVLVAGLLQRAYGKHYSMLHVRAKDGGGGSCSGRRERRTSVLGLRLRSVRYAYWALRWFGHEFLGFAGAGEHFPVLTAGVRFLACLSIWGIFSVELRNDPTTDELSALAYLSLAELTAVLIGNIIKELAFSICAAAVTTSGHVFCRCGFTVGGRTFHEAYYPNSTWMRCESRGRRTLCEWTDPRGGCHRIEVTPSPRVTHVNDHKAPAILSWKRPRLCAKDKTNVVFPYGGRRPNAPNHLITGHHRTT